MRPKGSLQALINPGTEFEWTTYAFAGNDPLEVALKPGFFDHWAEILLPGDLILFGCSGLPPWKWSSLKYGFAPGGGEGNGKEAAYGRGDRRQATAG